jgi:hypothetical protein
MYVVYQITVLVYKSNIKQYSFFSSDFNIISGLQLEACRPYKAVIILDSLAVLFLPFIGDLIKKIPDNLIILLKVIGKGTILNLKKQIVRMKFGYVKK